ncbi:hemin uptake protein HemP [Noviherbaspirillum saxi]|uniref:Hemin uptake protein HemP n=2 Tax=Noviherbaspirillum saxi TaxID=2320863 RepID=A0A3A3GBF8_9BURK|nr:hemin uptake protein HemP [Noviherbaspirillum saxi]
MQQKEATRPAAALVTGAHAPVMRIKSEDLLQQQREVEIDHHGRIYRLRLTQLNKLILTA